MMKRLLSFGLVILILSSLALGSAAAAPDVTDAEKLNILGLFHGVGPTRSGAPDYALDRTTTRAEAVCMFVKLIGKEAEALKGTWTIPFTDVPEWAGSYIGYAYANKLTSGIGSNTFGSSREVTATEFLTLILSVLGYTSGSDFEWDRAWLLSDRLGLTDGRYNSASVFFRGDIARISFAALSAKHKYSNDTLCSMLIGAGVFTESAARDAGLAAAVARVTQTAAPDGSEFEKATFYLINNEREQHGLPPLEWNSKLAAVARAHSVDMSRRQFFSHSNPDGKNPADRMRAGSIVFMFAGENIARGYKTPESVVTAWMGSITHRNAILNEKATQMGIGVYNNYWTVDFLG